MTIVLPLQGTGAISFDVAIALGVIVEALIHGIYTSLFTSALPVLLRKRASDRRTTITYWVFLVTIILMYLVASSHTILTVYRFIRGYIVVVDSEGGGFYIFDFRRWDNVVNNFLLCFMTWLGDGLVIFRCYHVWDRNLWVIALPTLLLLTTIGINSTAMYWYNHPFDRHLDVFTLTRFIRTMYPLAFSQNFITTSLIAIRIWQQHRASSHLSVIEQGSGVSLIRILRIVVESAMIYTVQIFIIVILNALNNNFQVIVQSTIVPSIGIVFVLIAVRVHNAKSSSTSSLDSGTGVIPAWLNDEDASTIA